MWLLLIALGIQLLGGAGALLASARPRWATVWAVGGIVLGAVVGLVPTTAVLLGATPARLGLPWDVPFGALVVGLDALSALFLLPVFALSAIAAVYGSEYVLAHEPARASGASWFFFALLVTSMAMVLIARNAMLFLVAWEVMALASFFLVTIDDADASARAAGWTYLVAAHLGTACLLAMFALLGGGADPLDFERFPKAAGAGTIFVLAVVGFGTKAGFVPLHVWLPEAHPAAPSHVSAVMSGVMIKTGIYGLLRVLVLLGPPPAWWGWVLVAIGVTSGVLGILWALVQEDLKRALAYSSIENVGVIALALGLGLIGLDAGASDVAVLGFAAAFLHVGHHAVMKGLLFLGSGTVTRQTGTRRLEALGGLLRRLPRTGMACLVGSAALAGLPPLAGFASELLLFVAAYRATIALGGAHALPAMATIAALALIGGLASACFTKLVGMVFLGESRSEGAHLAREPGGAMQGAVLVLAAGCVALGALSPLVVRALEPVLVEVTSLPRTTVHGDLAVAVAALRGMVVWCGVLLCFAAAVGLVRRRLLSGRVVGEGPTWDCGYAAPSPRMQYTGSSFAQPLAAVFGRVVCSQVDVTEPRGFFPTRAAFASATPDVVRDGLYAPVFRGLDRVLARFRWLQHGQVQLYVLYVALTLVALLLWSVAPR